MGIGAHSDPPLHAIKKPYSHDSGGDAGSWLLMSFQSIKIFVSAKNLR
jgi:hypothetical protein